MLMFLKRMFTEQHLIEYDPYGPNIHFKVVFTVYDRDNKQITSSSHQPKGLDSLNFFVEKAALWSIDNEVNTCDGGDGTLYFIEGVIKGKSTGIVRWSPKLCKVESSNEFVELINFMKQKIKPLELSELTDSR